MNENNQTVPAAVIAVFTLSTASSITDLFADLVLFNID